MEMKNILPSKNLIIHHLKEKKNWFVLTSLILIITVLILPLLLDTEIEEGIIAIGIFEVFVIAGVNCLIDFNYLHDSRKYGYVLSKPIGSVKQLNLVLLINVIFSFTFMGVLAIIGAISGIEVLEFFLPTCSWLLVLIFLCGYSSHLSGNTIIAGIASLFNFAVPLFVLGVIYFAMDIVSNMVNGFNVTLLLDYVVEHIYRLDIIYFIKFVDYPNWPLYFAYLIGLLFGIYMLTIYAIDKRKNEYIGDHIVFKTYKYFVALLVSLLIPFVFIQVMNNNGFVAKLIAFLLLGSISYYVTLVILEKSFKLQKKAYKILAVFMAIFFTIVLIAGFSVKHFESKIPDLEDIEAVVMTDSTWVYFDKLDKSISVINLSYEDALAYNVSMYEDEKNIKLITDIHRSILENDNYQYYANVNIIYYLKNGKQVKRYFRLEPNDRQPFNTELDDIAEIFEETDEFKSFVMPYVYDEKYAQNFIDGQIWVDTSIGQKHLLITPELNEGLRIAIEKDIEEAVKNPTSFHSLNYDSHYGYYNSKRNMTYETVEEEAVTDSVEDIYYEYTSIRISSLEEDVIYLNLDIGFRHTYDYIKSLDLD